MGVFLTVIAVVGVVTLLLAGFGSFAKGTEFQRKTQDGDSFGSRMLGHGPSDEVFTPTPRDRYKTLTAWLRRHR